MKKLKGPIFLVGFMGSGKSYLSDSLTKSFPIFDMDNFLEKLESKTIGRIFIENGERV